MNKVIGNGNKLGSWKYEVGGTKWKIVESFNRDLQGSKVDEIIFAPLSCGRGLACPEAFRGVRASQ
ncbi:hypothetical protein B7P33_03040 [Sediminicola luteus]|uniref:Uncharacterized protein n=1 Tax=Sediminicola luteus TaxID=319238 RepID=A0A2A4GBF4_9FLAO|nr:hypothetical protein B7P33_03040 [Sediminicola luteus]